MWTPNDVKARFIEAVDIERRVVVKGISNVGNGWPQYKFDKEDRAGWDDTAILDDLERWQGRKFTTSAEQSRWQEVVFEWRLLIPAERRDLIWHFSECRARGSSFSKYCEDRGLVRMTAYRRIDAVLEMLASHLALEGRSLRPAALKWVLQVSGLKSMEECKMDEAVAKRRKDLHLPFRSEISRDLLKTPAEIAAFTQHLADTNDDRRRLQERRMKKALRGVPSEHHAA